MLSTLLKGAFLLIFALVISCKKETSEPNVPTLSNEVIIGTQTWMINNLDVDTFRNGDLIPQATTHAQWVEAANMGQSAWCYYNNDSTFAEKYGKLYNWYAVSDPRGLAPNGWKIPTDSDWTTLTTFLGGESVAGIKMKATTEWYSNNGTNESGFKGYPGGGRSIMFETFIDMGMFGNWWSTTIQSESNVWTRDLSNDFNSVFRGNSPKGLGLSVRCLRN